MTIRSVTLITIEGARLFPPVELIMREDMISIFRRGEPLMMDREQARQLHDALDAQFAFCD